MRLNILFFIDIISHTIFERRFYDMTKINVVLEGRFKNSGICNYKEYIGTPGTKFTKDTINSYQVIDETNKDQYSFWKGALGVALLGGWGAVAGLGGKNKKEYLIAIEWTYPKNSTNNKSLILLDERYYKVFVKSMF